MKKSKYIDHTILKADAKKADIEKVCKEAAEYDFASVCINPSWIALARELLEGTDVKVCTVVGFPLGAMTTEAKVFETEDAVAKGAEEIDMVINIGRLKDGDDAYVTEEIRRIKEACGGRILKVIIETCLLTDEEKVRACLDVKAAGADFVKTSTGFSTGGATPADVRLMKETVGSDVKVKAAGGVRTKEDLEEMIAAGAERIGTSRGVSLMQ
ncbi:MAG: deoxyribose-phosphate aldolase [Solobacterium sp.]|nr:deoxyribose-phosphate aldolase [Solobacterium sp.]